MTADHLSAAWWWRHDYIRRPIFRAAKWTSIWNWTWFDHEWHVWKPVKAVGKPFAWLANKAGDW